MTELARALKLCGRKPSERFSVAAIRDKEIRAECFDDVDAAERFLDQYADWNRYFCPNPVRPGTTGRPKADDVVEARVLLMDCDPDPDEKDASTAALRLARILETVGQYPILVDSGRGAQCWVRTGPLGNGARRRLARGLTAPQGPYGANGWGACRWDATHDPARLMRLPGTVNLKTGRTATIVNEGYGPPIDEQAIERLKLPSLDELEVKKKRADVTPPTPMDLEFVAGPAKLVWDEPVGKGERSKRDFRLVLALLKAGAPEDVACRLLYAMPGSKAAQDGRGDDYWTSTLGSVRRHMEQQERLKVVARELPEAAKDDPGAPFEREALDALLLVREEDAPGWQRLRSELKKAKVSIRVLEDAMSARARDGVTYVDAELRFVAQDAKRLGWFRRDRDGGWVPVDSSEAKAIMRASGRDPDVEIEAQTNEPWQLVNEPFQEEDLEGRRWNKDGARLAFEPKEGPTPTWDRLYDHVGRSLDAVVEQDEWCRAYGIRTGGQYLRVWVATMIQRPAARCAYLFLHGPQESGKSTFHESLKPLFTRGYARANQALRSKEGFNGEIANAVLCVIEEVNLSDQRRDIHERVKDWVTGTTICVRAMYRQAYDLPNHTHWIQAAQKRCYMPVLPGDTRITEIHVEGADDPMPKDAFMKLLLDESPAWLYKMKSLPLPPAAGRLAVPALATVGKIEQAEASGTELEEWLKSTGHFEMTDDELTKAFLAWVDGPQKMNWDRGRVMRELSAEARRDRRLVRAIRAIQDTETPLSTSRLLEMLPPEVRSEWGNTVRLGKALAVLSPRIPWMRRVTIKGSDVWRIAPSPTPTQPPPSTTDRAAGV